MTFSELNKKISDRDFKKIYFFYGDESYLKNYYCDKIIKAVVDDNMAGFNLFTYKEAFAPDELISAIEQPPVMSDRKICFLNNIDLQKTDQGFKDTLIKALSDIPEYTILVIKEAAVDKRSKIYNEIKKNFGEIIECNYPPLSDMRAFIGREFSKRGKKISSKLADKIADENEKSMYSVISLIETVSAYLRDTEVVTEEAISKFLNKAIDAVIFDLSDALVNFQKKRAFEILGELKMSSKNPPQVMFSLLARHILCLYICLINSRARIPSAETAKLLGKNTPEFVVSKYLRQANGISEMKLENLILFCKETDFKLKTGQISDPFMGIYSLFALYWD